MPEPLLEEAAVVAYSPLLGAEEAGAQALLAARHLLLEEEAVHHALSGVAAVVLVRLVAEAVLEVPHSLPRAAL